MLKPTSVSSITFCPAGQKPIDTYPDNFSEINASVVAMNSGNGKFARLGTALPSSKKSSNRCFALQRQNPASLLRKPDTASLREIRNVPGQIGLIGQLNYKTYSRLL